MCIHCPGNPFTEQLSRVSLGIVDMFIGHFLKTGVCLSACCMAMAVLIAHFEVSAQEQVYTPQY
jgi:hypothetical protein